MLLSRNILCRIWLLAFLALAASQARAALSIATASTLATGTVGAAYSQSFTASGGTSPYTWRLDSGTFPANLTLNTNVLSGIPSAAGTNSFTIRVTDNVSATTTKVFTVVINPPPVITTTSTLPGGTSNTAYSLTLAATNGTLPYTWSLVAGALPTTLTLASGTGKISGTPNATGTFTFSIQVSDKNNAAATNDFALTISSSLVITATSPLPGDTIGAAYSQAIAFTGGTAPFSWSVTSGTLPAGLTLTNDVLSGTPTATGSSTFTVKVIDAAMANVSKSLTMTIYALPVITTTNLLASNTVGAVYSQVFAATGGTPPLSWSLDSGAFPDGLALSTNVLSGTLAAAGTFNFTLRATDAVSVTTTKTFAVTINPPPAITNASTLASDTLGKAYSLTLGATGGITPYTWSIVSGSLPTNLTMNSSGKISGTPTVAGTSTFTVQVKDTKNVTATNVFSLTINPAMVITTASPLPNGIVGAAYSQAFALTGGTAPFVWSISSGSLPAGMTMDTTGLLSGAPAETGTFNFTVKTTDAAGATATKPCTMSISLAITLPDMLAIELPNPGQTSIGGSEHPMSDLLSAASTTGGLVVTCDGSTNIFPLGGTWVTWTSWAGVPESSPVASTRSSYVFVFRHGQTPVGVSGDDYATAGNHGTCIGRTPDGTLHAAWLTTGTNPDDGTERTVAIWYRNGTQDPDTGIVTWTDPVDVANGTADWNSYVKLSTSSNAVHFAWLRTGAMQVNYRRLVNNDGIWTFDPIQVLTNAGGHHVNDNGLVVAAFNDQEVHILASDLTYAYNTNTANASGWVYEHLVGPANKVDWKYPALAVDSRGDAHVAFTAVIRTPGNPADNYNEYWKVWYMHRKRPGPDSLGWVESCDVNANWPEWQDPGLGQASVTNDVAGDWMDIACDNENSVHIGWHGTAVSHEVGHDDAFYTRRAFAFDGQNSTGWEQPQRLHRHEEDTTNNLQYSWTPSFCCADTNGIVFPVIMYKALGLVYDPQDPLDSFGYYNDMDSLVRVLQDGAFIDDGEGINLSQAAVSGEKICTWWPNAARKLHWDAHGHAWLDILQGMDCGWVFDPTYITGNMSSSGIRTYVIHQRVDVTGFMPPTVIAQPADVTVGVGQTATFIAAAAGPTNGAPLSYQWTKNGAAIPGATNTSYTMDAAATTDDGSVFAVLVTAISRTTSRAAQLKVLTLSRAWSWGNSNTVWVLFSEPVQGGTENIADYSMNFGISITGAVLQADGKTVQLLTSGLVCGLDYWLTVNHVCAAAAPENPIATNSMTSFRYLPANVAAWVDDAVPDGAAMFADGGDAWTWVAANPAPFSGALAHQSNIASGESAHAFVDATQTLAVATNDTLFTYVYLDPANPPQEIMLAFYDGASWEHRAYWGASLITTGAEDTASCTNIGALPVAGQWARLEIPASALGLDGATLAGMSFMQYGGRATWDFSGTCSGTFHPVVDTTGCGIPDNWLVYYFGSTNAPNGGPNDDWDRDGVSNLREYLAGTNPTNAASRLDVTSCCKAGTGVTLSWQSVAGKSYGIQYSTNLASGAAGWTDIASNITATPPVNTSSCLTNPPGACFYRILLGP
jgi:hypothetical protein